MLTDASLERILAAVPRLRVAVVGDLFLDRYLDIDGTLTEPSVETGLDAYQIVRVRSYPGAAGTIVNNLAAFGVAAIHVVSVIGDDGEGYELRQALGRMPVVDTRYLLARTDRRTPTYTKPMMGEPGGPPRELNRLDIKNRRPLPTESETHVVQALDALWPRVDAILVLDQVSEIDCGVITANVRRRLAEHGRADPQCVVLADSRERIGWFTHVHVKPNDRECLAAIPGDVQATAAELARRTGRTVFCTRGDQGTLVAEPGSRNCIPVPAFPVTGPIDPVGAGDSTSAAIACALASGVTQAEAAAFGNLVASITIQQLGTTGTASPGQIRERWREVKIASLPRQRGEEPSSPR
jgi:bifunctional ADP-heptose synthase (sugar kinase/adenylyltransferase)